MKLLLDTGVLLQICAAGQHAPAKKWFSELLLAPEKPDLMASALAVFELLRGLERHGAAQSLAHFEELAPSLSLLAVLPDDARRASRLARAPATPRLSAADAIMAAQALEHGAVLVTADLGLRSIPGLDARDWTEIDPQHLDSTVPSTG